MHALDISGSWKEGRETKGKGDDEGDFYPISPLSLPTKSVSLPPCRRRIFFLLLLLFGVEEKFLFSPTVVYVSSIGIFFSTAPTPKERKRKRPEGGDG